MKETITRRAALLALAGGAIRAAIAPVVGGAGSSAAHYDKAQKVVVVMDWATARLLDVIDSLADDPPLQKACMESLLAACLAAKDEPLPSISADGLEFLMFMRESVTGDSAKMLDKALKGLGAL